MWSSTWRWSRQAPTRPRCSASPAARRCSRSPGRRGPRTGWLSNSPTTCSAPTGPASRSARRPNGPRLSAGQRVSGPLTSGRWIRGPGIDGPGIPVPAMPVPATRPGSPGGAPGLRTVFLTTYAAKSGAEMTEPRAEWPRKCERLLGGGSHQPSAAHVLGVNPVHCRHLHGPVTWRTAEDDLPQRDVVVVIRLVQHLLGVGDDLDVVRAVL